jgi:hypothetical protein
MFLLTHIAIPLIIFEIPKIKNTFSFNRFTLILGALFPDLIDKTLLFLGIASGRGISHSLIFNFLLFLMVILLFRKKYIYLPFGIGITLHLLLDIPDLPLFYPFILYKFEILEEPFSFYIHRLFTYPPVIISESLSIIILSYIIIKNKLIHLTQINKYLFITHIPGEINNSNYKT